ncbi:hypothetical protein HPULCUR_005365 [Helicostylum pulchrum]|uniref:Breast carcinoma-amplified sequence 1 n=1 Tax=Helicostylum pulchrum TaxID=562976 RepID=A0ABP9XYV1_9FUNG
MTIAAPESKGKEVATEEPTTLSTQVEPHNDAVTGEELLSEDKPISKKKSIFNHRFGNNKGTKKDVATNTEEVITAAAVTTTDIENKKSKGFGNFLSRVKQTGTTKELSEPVVLPEDENVVEHEDVHENVKTAETPTTTGDHAKRQSLLSKLFGNTKKEPMTESADQVVTTAAVATDQQTEEVTPSSPPLSRRVTGFFSKKKSEKKQGKATATAEKVETDELSAKDNTQDTPTVVVTNDENDAPTTVDESTTLPTINTNTQGITA